MRASLLSSRMELSMAVSLSVKLIAGGVLLVVILSLAIFGPSYCHRLQGEAA